MKIIEVITNKDIKKFKKFRKRIYRNDPYYVSTIEFTCDMLLKKETLFAKQAKIIPLMVVDGSKIIAECMLIHNSKDDFLQMSFFEALPNQEEAVRLLKETAKNYAISLNLKRLIVGLNGHLSYGVGLSVDMCKPNTFDSTYSKPYYLDYFYDGIEHNLYSFSNKISNIVPNLKCRNSKITIRPMDLSKFDEEMELFRVICNETIGKTFLYSEADYFHFSDLMESMKFFLRPENLLFACNKDEVVGFIFWHPDYNEILAKGRHNSLLEIAVRYTFNKKKINKVKLNSIGVKDEYQGNVTMMLLCEAAKYMKNYSDIETNFVWENNRRSMKINKHLIQNIERSFKVVEYRYD